MVASAVKEKQSQERESDILETFWTGWDEGSALNSELR